MSELIDEVVSKRWIFVSGKGGTGKTTTAASLAIYSAEKGNKTLVVSLDPAHSLSDSFMIEIGSEVRQIHGKNLYGLEFDIKKAFKEEQEKFRDLTKSDNQFMFPGLGEDYTELLAETPYMPVEYFEGVGFIKLFKDIEESDFDTVIFDTAPTGHTLKLLELPEFLDSFLGKMLKLQLRLSSIFNSIKRFFGFGEAQDHSKLLLQFLEDTKKTVEDVKMKITNKDETEFIVVGIPAMMSLLESIRLVTELDFYRIPNTLIVVNMVRIYGGQECVFSKKMASLHYSVLKEYRKEFYDKQIHVIPFFADEIRGVDKLRKPLSFLKHFTIEKALEAIEEGQTIE